MHRHVGEIVVVQAGAAELGIGELKAQRLDEVQWAPVTAARRIALPVFCGMHGA